MESFARFLLKTDTYKDRIFISNPPSAALLIWTNKDFLPNITGYSIVEKIDCPVNNGLKSETILSILQKQTQNILPSLYIQYDGEMNFMIINGERLSIEEAASKISSTFKISLGKNPAKKPNNPSQINDPFHIWSRDAFDGISVMKTDIDIITTKDNKVTSLIEIKRSKVVKVGTWTPYINPASSNNDVNNFLIMMSFCNLLKCILITIHHEEPDSEVEFSGDELIDVFTYNPMPNQSILNSFGSANNRKTITIKNLIGIK